LDIEKSGELKQAFDHQRIGCWRSQPIASPTWRERELERLSWLYSQLCLGKAARAGDRKSDPLVFAVEIFGDVH
jgi:hypothetical protein